MLLAATISIHIDAYMYLQVYTLISFLQGHIITLTKVQQKTHMLKYFRSAAQSCSAIPQSGLLHLAWGQKVDPPHAWNPTVWTKKAQGLEREPKRPLFAIPFRVHAAVTRKSSIFQTQMQKTRSNEMSPMTPRPPPHQRPSHSRSQTHSSKKCLDLHVPQTNKGLSQAILFWGTLEVQVSVKEKRLVEVVRHVDEDGLPKPSAWPSRHESAKNPGTGHPQIGLLLRNLKNTII